MYWLNTFSKDIDVVMFMYNLIELSDICSKTSRSVRRHYRDEPALTDAGKIIDFPDGSTNSVFVKVKKKQQIKQAMMEMIMVTLKYLINF